MGARRLCDAWGLFRSKSSPLWPRFGLYSPIYTPLSSLQDPIALITRTPASPGQFTAQSQSQEDNRSSRDCGWGLLFWSLSYRGKLRLWVHPTGGGQYSWVCRLRAPGFLSGGSSQAGGHRKWGWGGGWGGGVGVQGLPSAAEWGASPGLHYSPALTRGPCCLVAGLGRFPG